MSRSKLQKNIHFVNGFFFFHRYSINGEQLGTFDGHGGAVWCLDVDWKTQNFASGAADNSIRMWDVCTGKELERIGTKTAVRTCNFSYSGNMLAYTTDKQMGYPCNIQVVDVRDMKAGTGATLKAGSFFGPFPRVGRGPKPPVP